MPATSTPSSSSACARSDEGATTSQPSVGDFIAVYEPLLAEGREIVSIHLSAGISGNCESARAGEAAPDRRGQGRRADPGLRQPLRLRRAGPGGARCGRGRRAAGPTAPRRWPRRSVPATSSRCGSRSTRSSTCARAGGSVPPRRGSARRSRSSRSSPSGEEITPVERVRTRRRAFERMVELRAPAPRRRRRRVGRPAHPGSRDGAAPGRAGPRALRLRPDFRLRGRPGDRRRTSGPGLIGTAALPRGGDHLTRPSGAAPRVASRRGDNLD